MSLVLESSLEELADEVVHEHARDDLEVVQLSEQCDQVARLLAQWLLLLGGDRGRDRTQVRRQRLDERLHEAGTELDSDDLVEPCDEGGVQNDERVEQVGVGRDRLEDQLGQGGGDI